MGNDSIVEIDLIFTYGFEPGYRIFGFDADNNAVKSFKVPEGVKNGEEFFAEFSLMWDAYLDGRDVNPFNAWGWAIARTQEMRTIRKSVEALHSHFSQVKDSESEANLMILSEGISKLEQYFYRRFDEPCQQ